MRGDLVDEDTIRQVISLYYGMNTFIDTEVGRFLAELEGLGLKDDTLIIYVSDHGEYFGEHRMIHKSKAAYDCLIHVPFIIRAPGALSRPLDSMVSLEDLMPTILSYADIAIPANVHGRDLKALLEGEPFEERDYAYGEYSGHAYPVPSDLEYPVCKSPHSPDFRPAMKLGGQGKMRYIRTKRWKMVIYVQDKTELYDLATDPHELNNLYGTPAIEEITSSLKDRLIEHMMVINHTSSEMGRWS